MAGGEIGAYRNFLEKIYQDFIFVCYGGVVAVLEALYFYVYTLYNYCEYILWR
jgi:hypothetical protein